MRIPLHRSMLVFRPDYQIMISNVKVQQYFEFSHARTVALYAELDAVKVISCALEVEGDSMKTRKLKRVEALSNALLAVIKLWEESLNKTV